MTKHEEQVALVARRLGAGAAKMYGRVLGLLEAAPRDAARDRSQIRAMIIELLCGAFHDYRSEHGRPKDEFLGALARLEDAATITEAQRVAAACRRGEFDEDDAERKRYADRLVAAHTRARVMLTAVPAQTCVPVDLTARESDVFHYLARYVEVFRKSPTRREICDGTGLSDLRVGSLLKSLEAKGVAAQVGGARGWFPTRAA